METGHQLAEAFYTHMKHDPVLLRVYPKHLRCAIEGLGAFLNQLLGGPCEYSERRWSLSLREAHLRFKIGPEEREAWLKTMSKALQDVAIEESAREALRQFFEEYSAYLVNTKPLTIQPKQWNGLGTMEEVVAGIRKGEADRVLDLIEGPVLRTHFERDRAGFLSLLALMIRSYNAPLVDYVRHTLLRDPTLARERHAGGRTLLHDAAGAGSVVVVELLLELSADPNALNQGGHAPLYCAGNECGTGKVVRALVARGADVNACGGVKHCTALHMAARRGNVPVAEALLACGADLEARDTMGVTPLRRAVNCRKKQMVDFLSR
jgi:truncated hemoglobin YjbI